MIHPLAYIDPKAELGRNVSVGPHSFIGAGVALGDDCVVHNGVTIAGNTICGRGNVFYPGAVLGMAPQDLKYKGGPTRLEIGDDNAFREHVTIHPGTEIGGGVTRIGSHNRFLVAMHVGHDCTIGNDCIFSNSVQMAGHVCIEDRVTVGAMTGLQQFLTVGTLAYVGGLARVTTDVPPYLISEGYPAQIRGFNEVGMRRWSFSDEQIRGIREAYMALFSARAERSGLPLLQRLAQLEQRPDLNGEVRYLCQSIRRSLEGVYGRHLERHRQDSSADLKSFYGSGEEPKK